MKAIDQRRWMQDCMRRVGVGFHVPDTDQTSFPPDRILSKVDPCAIVRKVKQAGAQVFWFYSKCHNGNAYYPSKVGHVHSALKGRDLFGELAQACLAEGIMPGCFYEFSDMRILRDKPDWCHKVPKLNEKGEVEMTDGAQGAALGGACLNGPYGEFALQQTLEVVSQYPIRAYYVDFLGRFDVRYWICPYCNEKFKKEFGFDFPGDARKLPHDQYVAYLKWHYRQYDQYCKRLRAEINRVNPDIMFTHNLHGIFDEPIIQTWELAAENCDYYTHDLFTLRDGTLLLSFKSRLYAERTRRRNGAAPGEELIDSVVCTRGDFLTPKALDGYRAEMWTARACGVATMASFIMNVDGSCDDHVFALFGKIFKEQKRYEPWLKDLKPLAAVALLRSQQTIEYRPPAPNAGDTPLHSAEFQGWAQICIESHQLWNAIQDCHVTPEQLGRYRVLIAPHAACLSATQIQAIMVFVRNGGTLIVTGETSLYDENGRRRPDFGLAETLGLSCLDDLKPDHRFLCLRDKRLRPREHWVSDMLVFHEGQMAVRTTRPLSVLAVIGDKLPEYTLANQVMATDLPGLVHGMCGKGQVYYFAGLPGQQYLTFGYHTIRRVVTWILNQAVGQQPLIRLEAPATVELFAHTQGSTGNLVINLVNNVSGISRSTGRLCKGSSHFEMTEHMPPVSAAEVRIRLERGVKVAQAYLAPGKTPLKCGKSGTEHVIRLTNLGVHTMVVIETLEKKGKTTCDIETC